ncbi:MAG: hypothetical protein EBR82_20260 [Caulobacteraceae bacterium]|nr:hypothetical protein [Caulobacteraceae bacterium]
MRMKMGGIAVAGISLALSGCGAQVESLPTQFQGQWARTAALCNAADGAALLTVSATKLGFAQGEGALAGPVRTLGERASGAFDITGADDQYEGVRPHDQRQSGELVLTDHGAGLILTLQGHRQNYVRCTGGRA